MTSLLTPHALDQKIEEVARALDLPFGRIRTTFIGVITAQMLPNSVHIKGGLAIKMKLGEVGTRATSDLDGVYTLNYEDAIHQLRQRLKQGWGKVQPSKKERRRNAQAPERIAFTGTLTEKSPHDPGVDRPEYLMRPSRITLNFLGKPWGAIDLELAHPEAPRRPGTLKAFDGHLVETFQEFGFGHLEPVHFLAVEIQIAQKIHGLTRPDSDRAHDLVDLQLLWSDDLDLDTLRRACEDTFRYRKVHSWPPLPLRSMREDKTRYAAAVDEVQAGTPPSLVRSDLDEARNWLVSKIEKLS